MRATSNHIAGQLSRSLSRQFSSTSRRSIVKDLSELPNRITPRYVDTPAKDLLSITWASPPRNILLVKKNGVSEVTSSLVELSRHINSTYPCVSIILEPHVAHEVHNQLPFPVYTTSQDQKQSRSLVHEKVDLAVTLGGDGTILHASSLFSSTSLVPPILSFSMGTLGFLGEWKFHDYKRAFREVYMSGSTTHLLTPTISSAAKTPESTSWSSIRGQSLGPTRSARVLLRNRLKVGLFSPTGTRLPLDDREGFMDADLHAMNEVIIHRGASPHLAHISVSVGGRFLTEAVADGMIISTPTGSTAYSLSSGGSIIHPLVSSLLLTPICPRSLSFRPLVIPATTEVTLRMSERNRNDAMEVSIDGRRRAEGVGVGMVIRVRGEEIKSDRGWGGGVPCVMRGTSGDGANGDEGWVGGLNSLLKFNYPFGDEGR